MLREDTEQSALCYEWLGSLSSYSVGLEGQAYVILISRCGNKFFS